MTVTVSRNRAIGPPTVAQRDHFLMEALWPGGLPRLAMAS